MRVSQRLRTRDRYITQGEVGIEVEMEGMNLPTDVPLWRIDEDGSLKGNSAEYVLSRPMSYSEGYGALDTLMDKLIDEGSVVRDTVRAGVHIHINVQHMEFKELLNFITLYILFEEVLVGYCGEGRQGNLFCLRIKDAEDILFRLKIALVMEDFESLHTDELRYGSMNLKALGDYGSLEFRAMRSTIDFKRIKTWIGMLKSLKDLSSKWKDPLDLMKAVDEVGVDSFFLKYMAKYVWAYKMEGLEGQLKRGRMYALELAHCVNWENFKDNLSNPFMPHYCGVEL